MKKILRHILIALTLMILWASFAFISTLKGLFHQPIAKQETTLSFLEAVETTIDEQFVGNFAMAILKDGEVEFERFHSVGSPVDRNTIFQVSSLSKWVSAFGIMKLVEAGRIDLDAPVSNYLTRWQLPPSEFNNDDVTVRRLLSHTAGLTDELGYSGFEAGTPIPSLEQSLTLAPDADEGTSGIVQVGIAPGSEFKYSGGGYTLLQLLVEEVTGKSFNSYMRASIFRPLGMEHSTYVWEDTSKYTLTEFYNGDGLRSKHYRYASLAATSLYTSLSDLELFFQAHLKGKNGETPGRSVLKPETVRMMRQPHASAMGADIWGLGTILFAPTGSNDFIIGHDGKSTPPINTAVRLNPETGDGIIVLETGHSILATKLASEWVFWKTGKVDTLLFSMLMDGMVSKIGIGWGIISIVVLIGGIVKSRRMG
jgi:CubicO group peptidase (beta-lactamase class C family)